MPETKDNKDPKDPKEAKAVAAEAKPAPAKPAEGKAAEGKPAPAKPADGKPAEGKPADGKEAAPTKEAVLGDDLTNVVLAPIKRKKGAKKQIANVTRGVAHVHATFNNTKVYISDTNGNVVAWASAGKVGFKGSRKSTAYAAQVVAVEAAKRAMGYGMREVEVEIRGPGAGRESAVRGIVAAGLEISTLRDVTPVPHNGCRPPKRRRV